VTGTQRLLYSFDPNMPTADVAKALLGAELHVIALDGQHASGRIVETEAYLGLRDPAAHSFHGKRTARVTSMYRSAGHAYVYRIYGLHLCLNVVTRDESSPEAVLIRAARPLTGLAAMRARRGVGVADEALARGPGNLTRAFGIGAQHDGHRLTDEPMWVEPGAPIRPQEIAVSPRIGLSSAQPARAWPLRFYVAGEAGVSRARGLPEAEGGPAPI
jgi:DNA-3-methyladenine glycosylase